MSDEGRECGRQDVKVDCPDCKGTGKRQNLYVVGFANCKLCRGSGRVPQEYVLTKLEDEVIDCIYAEVPVSAMCPRCETDIDPDNCIEDTISSRKEWAKMVREVIKIVKEAANENQQ